jgi:hypothetical protein
MPLHLIAFAAAAVALSATDVAPPLQSCARGVSGECVALRAQLAAVFGVATSDDRCRGQGLTQRLVDIVERPPIALQPALRECSHTDCGRLANIVVQLFSGGDAALDRSRERFVARALAHHLVDAKEDPCDSR